MIKIFAFPYAFGSADAFLPLDNEFGSDTELIPVEYSGHYSRYREPLLYAVNEIALDVYKQIGNQLDEDYIFFGYSMGGIIAYEVYNLIKRDSRPLPKHIIIFGAVEPELTLFKDDDYESYDDNRIKELMKSFGGTPEKLLNDDSIIKYISPFVKSDCIALRDYEPDVNNKITVPLTIYKGQDENNLEICKENWKKYCSNEFTYNIVPGGHFFLFENGRKKTAEYAGIIESIIL